MTELEDFRIEKDSFFAGHPQSPLTADQKLKFSGLEYYPENPDLRLVILVEEFPDREQIEMQTSTGDTQVYIRYGRITFDVEGEEAALTVFASQHGFFLPFVDAGAGKETYGAGRYLDPEVLPDGRMVVDFNHAYNPYCAYNEFYSCPLTPWENRLSVSIKAGEKLPENEWVTHSA